MTQFIATWWSAYAICYGIGYMLWIRPRYQNKFYDMIFFFSLIVFSTIKFISTKT
jgi:bacteriorhodopsin